MDAIIWEWPKEWRGVTDSKFQLASSSLSSSSPYTGQMTPYGPQVQLFAADLTFPQMKAEQWRRVQGFITRLRGINGLIRIVDYHRMKPAYDQFEVRPSQQPWSDGTLFTDRTGWVDGFLPASIVCDVAADEGETSIVVRGLPPSLTKPLGMGDLFEVRPDSIPANHGHLYEIVSDSNTNADGKTRLYFEPGLRKPVAAGDMVVLRYPTSVFRLTSDTEGQMSRTAPGSFGNVGFSLTEVVPWQ